MQEEEMRLSPDDSQSGQTGEPEEEMKVRTSIYPGREAVHGMVEGISQNMSRGVGRCRSRSIQAAVDMYRMMSCTDEEIRGTLMSQYGLSEEEADSYLTEE